ncbi:MAG: hypothetical protein ACPLRA_01225 [Candidatus Saccharicenans sp.]
MAKDHPEKKRTLFFKPALIPALILIILAACESRSPVKGLVVNPEFSDQVLTDNLVTRLRVKFITTSIFQPLDQGYQLVVSANWQGKLLFREYLEPQTPPSKWLANRVYEVEKYLYIPSLINIFDPRAASGIKIDFSLRLEKPSQRQSLLLYFRRLKVQPCPADVPDVVLLDGWEKIKGFPADLDSSDYELWTGQKAICLLKNPGRPAILMIDVENVQENELGVSLFLNGGQLDQLSLGKGEFKKFYPLSASALGSEPELKLVILVDKTLRLDQIYPELKDEREVGLKIKRIYFR